MSKSNHFFGQPLYGQLINLLDKEYSLFYWFNKFGCKVNVCM